MVETSKYANSGYDTLEVFSSDTYTRNSFLIHENLVLIEVIGSPEPEAYYESNKKFEQFLENRPNKNKIFLVHDFSRMTYESKNIRRHYIKWLVQNKEHFEVVLAFGMNPALKATIKALRYFTLSYLNIKLFSSLQECIDEYVKHNKGIAVLDDKNPNKFQLLWSLKKELITINGQSYKLVRREEWKGRIRNFHHETFVVDGNIVVRVQKGDYEADMLPELIEVLNNILKDVGAFGSKFYYILDMKHLKTNLEGRKKSTTYFRDEIENTELLIFANLNPVIRIAVNFGRHLFPDKMDYAFIEKDIDSALKKAISHKYIKHHSVGKSVENKKLTYEELRRELDRVSEERDKHIQNAIVALVNSTWEEEAEVEMIEDEDNPFSELYATVKMVRRDLQEMFENEIALRKKAEEADKLKSAFLANISHELRTPMNAITGFTELLMMNPDNSSQTSEYLGFIKDSSDHLLNLINDLINISKIEAGNFELVFGFHDIDDLVLEVCNNFKRELNEKPGKINLLTSGDPAYYGFLVKSDKLRLKQVLINLVGNAIKFTNEGFVKIDHKIIDNQLVFQVSDTGIGIANESQSKIFERFTQADATLSRKFGGTGLGLTITKNLVELMGGKISVISKQGHGSTFTFSIPVEIMKIEHLNIVTQEADELLIEGKNILIVDDIDVSSRIIEIMLGKNNNFHHVTNGSDAVNEVKNGFYDLVYMDIQMPVMNGYQAVNEIRNFNKTIPIIAQTANAFANDRDKILASGFDGYISKPIIKENLLSETSRVLSK